MKKLIFLSAATAALMPAFAGLVSGSVSVSTDENRFTIVSYQLADDPAVVTFDVTTNGVSVGGDALSTARGDVWKLMPVGTHSFKLRLDRELPEGVFEAGDFAVNVTAWPVNDPPNYMVINLITNETDKIPTISYYPSAKHLPAGGLSNRTYATSKLVMRKIPAAYRRWQMGNIADKNAHDVILTENYYMGIYELTECQRNLMKGSAITSSNAKPRVQDYNTWRGTAWPTGGHSGAAGDMAIFCAFTGLELDLPTEAQWEFAARAGEYKHTLYNGKDLVVTGNLAPMLDDIAWYGYNATNVSGKCELKSVGLLAPNAFGLYDVLGNVAEYCLDFWRGLPGPVTIEIDPVGGTSGNRVLRGGTYNHAADRCTLVSRGNLDPSWWNDGVPGVDGSAATCVQGARLTCPAVAVR